MWKQIVVPRMFWLPVSFAIFGGIMLQVMFGPKLVLFMRSAHWDRVEAQVLSAAIVREQSAGGQGHGTCVYNAEYTFTYQNQQWHGNRASVVGWGPKPHKDVPELQKLIDQHNLAGEWGTALAWVNPQNPRESVLFRQWDAFRTAGTALFSLMVLIPCGVLVLIAATRGWRWWLGPLET